MEMTADGVQVNSDYDVTRGVSIHTLSAQQQFIKAIGLSFCPTEW